VALMKDGAIVYEAQLVSGRTHSQRVMPMVDTALSMSDMQMSDIDLFGAVLGPGSFTGVRIGVSTVKALAHAAGKPCIGVDALHALAANVSGFDGVVCPILDARAQQVYGAMFECGMPPVRLMEDEAEKLTLFLDRVEATGKHALFLGDGVEPCRAAIEERLGEKAHFAPAQHQGLRAASACALAMQTGAEAAILKARSPSCGSGRIYDGTFSGTLADGDGVTAAAVKQLGIPVYTEETFPF
jgi:tRNA threonylcarbamoyladenosine biosynthesis protein TsaB